MTSKTTNPLDGLTAPDLLHDSVAINYMQDALERALTTHVKAKARVRSPHGRRVLSLMRTDLIRLQKLTQKWEKYVQDAS